MLRIDRLCIYLVIFGLVSLIPSILYLKFLDELFELALGGIALLDCIFNNNWRKYKPLWILVTIMTLYALYSFIIESNVTMAIVNDWIIEAKPFLPFLTVLCIGPRLTYSDKTIIQSICWINSLICIIALAGGSVLTTTIVGHPAFAGCIIFISAMFILYCNINANGTVQNTTLAQIIILLTVGLLCTRSKYYGIYVLCIYFIFIYRPGIMRSFRIKHAILIIGLALTIILVAWGKIEYYFITGGASESFDPEKVQSFARPVLYTTAWFILFDYFPFGSGLASFASYASGNWYSGIYYQYGIDNVYGLSAHFPAFICDAYYPSIAQFGIIGLILFIVFWCYAYNFLRILIRVNVSKHKYIFIIGSLIICYILIECIAGTVISQCVGMMPMTLLGIISAQGRKLSESTETRPTSNIDYIRKI